MPTPVTRLSSVRLASSLFESSFSSRPAVAASAPGRVNLIGEHTDYNGGPVLPVALERRTAVAAALEDGWFFVSALDGTVRGVEIDRRSGATGPTTWSASSASCGRSARRPLGARVAVASTLPVGAGLSSSAALTVAAAKALSLLAGRRLTPAQLVDVAYRAEHDQVGVALRAHGSDDRGARRPRARRCCSRRRPARSSGCRSRAGSGWWRPASPTGSTGGELDQRRRECEEALATLSRGVAGAGASGGSLDRRPADGRGPAGARAGGAGCGTW